MTAQYPFGVVKSPIPDLRIGPYKTESHALHDQVFMGRVIDWESFEAEAMSFCQQTDWKAVKRVIAYKPGPNISKSHTFFEHFVCADEIGVQGRLNHHVGQVLTSICKATGVDISFGTYKASKDRSVSSGIPDIVGLSGAWNLRIVGEVKTPWVELHHLRYIKYQGGLTYKRLLGQVARYMKEAKLKYAFLSTYNQTLFLKQEFFKGQWCLFVSEVIDSTTAGGPRADKPSLRECFWLLCNLAAQDHFADNDVNWGQWVE